MGKSSVFNALLTYKRSIVTEIAGTTRDSIQESLNIGKHNTVLIDTAGIRNTKDKVEQLGIDRSNEEIKNADILLHIIDAIKNADYKKLKNQIAVLNKIDLLSKNQERELKGSNTNAVFVSAKDKTGINLLIEKIEKKLATITNHNQNEHITSLRQEQLLIKINKTVLPIIKQQETNIEIIAHHTKESINHIEHLHGKTSVDDILDDVFSNFCGEIVSRETKHDLIIVGGGHAGVEAANISSKIGCKTAIVTMDKNSSGRMSCNPAVGGVAKGQIVREIDLLGGFMAGAADFSGLQFKTLYKSKGRSVWSPRAQTDKRVYERCVSNKILQNKKIEVVVGEVVSLVINKGNIEGVVLRSGEKLFCNAVVITCGTFLSGMIHVGDRKILAGRMGESSSIGITEYLNSMGFKTMRLKTGTPLEH